MKTKALAIVFLVIVFAVAFANAPNIVRTVKTSMKASASADEAIDNIEDDYSDGFATKFGFVEINGLTCKTLQNQQINGTVVLDNGSLSYKFDEENIEPRASRIARLDSYLKEKGISFTYIAVPYKNSSRHDEIPYGLYDHGNENQESMMSMLKSYGVDTLDLVSALEEKMGADWYDAYFRTDHHWKPETAFWAHTQIAEHLSSTLGLGTDDRATDIDNYRIRTYENQFLGSQGKKTGRLAAGLDDLSIITPKWKTDIKVTIPTQNVVRSGSFEDAVIDRECLEKDYYHVNSYAAYLGNMLDLCTIENRNAVNHSRLLVVKDSFSIATAPYLVFMFDEVDVIDLRYYDEGTLRDYIEKTEPDAVIMPYSASVFGSKGAFDFGL